MPAMLKKLSIKGFKSIRNLENLELTNLNIILGENGMGKSNFIAFFKLLQSLRDGSLQNFIQSNGGAGDILFQGRKVTEQMEFQAQFTNQQIHFQLIPTPQDGCILDIGPSSEHEAREPSAIPYGIPFWQVYHFHDTSTTAGMRHYEIIQDNKILRCNGDNIAPFLLNLRNSRSHKKYYNEIVHAIRAVNPLFDDFRLDVSQFGEAEKVNLSWNQKGSDHPMQPYHLSDGTLRFICLATALLQPEPPSIIIIDEPELGLHPGAIAVLAELIEDAATRTQVIVATQSPALVDYFSIEDLIVVRQKQGSSVFSRLKEEDFSVWLEEYTIGELWSKNVIHGGPIYE